MLGCGQTVVLGSECPAEPALCLRSELVPPDARAPGLDDAGGTPSDANSLDDAEASDAEVHDSALPDLDADVLAPDGGPAPNDAGALALFPALENGSFEITRGGVGDIAWQPPGSPALGFTRIEPWQACRSRLQVQATYGSGSAQATPVDQSYFVVDQFAMGNPVGLNQQLAEPMRKGQRYAFQIALRVAQPGDAVSLNVFGTNVQCLPNGLAPLATSRVIVETTWQHICIQFTASETHLALMLGSSAELSGAALLMDDLRYDPACAAP